MDIGGTAAGFLSQGWNMKFAEEMASSQYQRAVNDMKQAGLNPNAVFGSGGGSPAAAPGGQGGTAMSGEGLSGIVNTAKDISAIKALNAETQNKEAQNKLIQAQTSTANATAKATEAAAEVSAKSDKAYAKSLDNPLLKTVDTFKKYIPLDRAVSWIGSAFGGRSSAKQSTPDAALTLAPQKSSSAKSAANSEPKEAKSAWDQGAADAAYMDSIKRQGR